MYLVEKSKEFYCSKRWILASNEFPDLEVFGGFNNLGWRAVDINSVLWR